MRFASRMWKSGSMSEHVARACPTPATVRELVGALEALLTDGGVVEARREARDIVAAVLDVPRFWPSMHPDVAVDATTHRDATAAALRRARGAPFAYAVGRAAFRHLTLMVDERVLIPRVETEELVELVLALGLPAGGTAIDVGTGSGAIALALAMEARFDRIIATDISRDAIVVARSNAQALARVLKAPVEFRVGSFLHPVKEIRARVICANLPYIAHDEAGALPASVRDWEPAVALFSPDEGMAAIRALLGAAPAVLERGGHILLEVDARRASLAAEMAATNPRYHDVAVRLDLAGRERFIVATCAE
jgi:release factor glutamine methyltransferase